MTGHTRVTLRRRTQPALRLPTPSDAATPNTPRAARTPPTAPPDAAARSRPTPRNRRHLNGGILLECIRPGDLAARLGGDESVLVLDAADRGVALRRGEEVAERIATEPWSALRPGLQVDASVGVAWGASGGVALYREADEGLYRAKRAGGGTVRGGANHDAEPATGTTTATPA